ncbi:MAG: AAA family ATPase [Planctomycetes bacterium]|nr:AAA family ATPase [Planctomycetota bacterium]
MHVLAIGNQKGGTSKTTTAGVLAVVLSRSGAPVHVIDMDPQSNLTSAFGRRDDEGLLYRAMTERAALPMVRLTENLTLTPSSVDLARGESQLLSEPGRESILKACLAKSGVSKDAIVIIDCPPSLGVLALNCLTAADSVLVTVQPGGFELRALARLQRTVELLREQVNPGLEILGTILTNCVVRRAITHQVRRELERRYRVLGLVRTDARLLYATTEGRLLDLREGNALEDYAQVAGQLEEMSLWRARSAA